jgi:hypothetical protein
MCHTKTKRRATFELELELELERYLHSLFNGVVLVTSATVAAPIFITIRNKKNKTKKK